MNEQLVFELSVDTVDLVKGLATAKNGLDQFAEVGKTSIAQLNAALKALEAQAGKSVNPAEIEKLKGSYAEVKAEVTRFRKEFRELKKDSDDVGNSIATTGSKSKKAAKDLEELDPVAKRSRIAVYGLNQVVRDLPFGFIAISNNIPVLFDQLNALRQETGSNRAAFKAFYDGLVGAGGVTIGLSILVSSVTAAVQKYGSLRGAVDAFLITNGDLVLSLTDATKKLKDYNKELKTAGQIQQRTDLEANAQAVQAQGYADAIFDLTKSERERGNALKRLQALDKDVFGSLDLQKTGVIELTAAVDTYLAKIGQSKKIDAYQKQVDLTTTTLADQKDILNALGAEIAALEKKQASGTLQYATSSPIVQSYGLELDILRAKYKTTQQAIDQLNVKLKDQKQAVKEVTIENTKFDTGLEETTDATDAQKKAIDKEIASLIRRKKEYTDSLTSLSNLGQEYVDVQIAIAKIDAAIKKLKTDSIAEKLQIDIDLGETIKKLIDGANTRIKESRGIDFTPLFQTTGDEFKKRTTEIFNPAQVNRFSEALKTAGNVSRDIKISLPENLKKQGEEVNGIIKQAKDQYQDLQNIFSGLVSNFVDGIFDGKNAVDSLTTAFKRALVQLTALIAKTIILKTIETAGNIASGGTTGAAKGVGSFLQGLFSGGGVSAPRGGINIGQGGFALSGQVVFVQRGQDLVGVLSQSNARIGRVG